MIAKRHYPNHRCQRLDRELYKATDISMNRKILMLTLLMAAVPGISHGGSVYKWTDENGVTHFGDQQPNGRKSEQVNVRVGTGSAKPADQATPQEKMKDLEDKQKTRTLTQKEKAQEEARRKQREANCATARSNLDIIDSKARIRVEENGESRYLSPEEIAQQRQKYEEITAENCGPEKAQ